LWQQGDQMSFKKTFPKCSPTHFSSKWMHNFCLGNKNLPNVVNNRLTGKSSGHPAAIFKILTSFVTIMWIVRPYNLFFAIWYILWAFVIHIYLLSPFWDIFVGIWYTYYPHFGIFCGHLLYLLSPFWYIVSGKIWQPRPAQSHTKVFKSNCEAKERAAKDIGV
jgi:hypothetical protein